MEDKAVREIIVYEYRFEMTPRYIAEIKEDWELHDVFPQNGVFIAVFRRQMPSRSNL